MKTDQTIHILRFGSPIIKFQTNSNFGNDATKNHLFVLLQEGLLKIFNMHSMEQDISIKTFQMHQMKGSTLSHQRYDAELLAAAAFIPDFDISHNIFAYVYNEINEEDVV